MNAQPEIHAAVDADAVVDVSDAGRLQLFLGEPDRKTARAEIDGWTSQQLKSNGRGIDLTAAAPTGADLSSLNLRGATLSQSDTPWRASGPRRPVRGKPDLPCDGEDEPSRSEAQPSLSPRACSAGV